MIAFIHFFPQLFILYTQNLYFILVNCLLLLELHHIIFPLLGTLLYVVLKHANSLFDLNLQLDVLLFQLIELMVQFFNQLLVFFFLFARECQSLFFILSFVTQLFAHLLYCIINSMDLLLIFSFLFLMYMNIIHHLLYFPFQ